MKHNLSALLLASSSLVAATLASCAPVQTVESAPAVGAYAADASGTDHPSAALAVLADLNPPWTEKVAPSDARADLDALYAGLRSGHYDLYANRTEAEYDALHGELHAAFAAPVSRFELLRSLQRFAAFGNVAHARIDLPGEIYSDYRAAGGKALPLYPRIDGGVAYVGENLSGVAALEAGDRILLIDGEPTPRWLERMAAFIASDTPDIAHSLLEFTFPRDLWLLTGERQAHQLRIRKPDGRELDVRVPTLGADAQAANAEAEDAMDGPALREARMVAPGIAYLKPGPFYHAEDPASMWDTSPFTRFIDDAFTEFAADGATRLILDLRDNPGGDNSFSDPMLAYLADEPFRFYSTFRVRSSAEAEASNAARMAAKGNTSGVSGQFAESYAQTPYGEVFDFELDQARPRADGRFKGEVYALIDRNSYSNAVNVAAILQDYGWATLVGEPTTDFATTYGSMETFTLPQSGFTVGFPKSHIIRPNGDATPGPVTPDVVISAPVVSDSADPVLDTLVQRIEAGAI
ncbi:MAG: S41 family peptidase [Pseudomonadota bacterium]